MRIELIYKPGCNSYKKALNILETIIAEERLPISVEVVECQANLKSPTIRIDGLEIDAPAQARSGLEPSRAGLSAALYLETLRDLLSGRWKELTRVA